MFSFSYSTPAKIKGHIKFTKFPMLGSWPDVNGKIWHIYGIMGKYIQAQPIGNVHSYYTSTASDWGCSSMSSTAGSGVIHQTWEPYTFEVIKKND